MLVHDRHFSCSQAAVTTRVPESVVKQQLHDCLHAIRAHLARVR
ncbi:hypothetical protein [Nocardia blacklockiae]